MLRVYIPLALLAVFLGWIIYTLFVKRDFFAIPVFAGETGHFTYAIPKGYLPSSIDSSIYNKAIPTLNKYKRARIMYTKNGQTKAFKLFKKLN